MGAQGSRYLRHGCPDGEVDRIEERLVERAGDLAVDRVAGFIEAHLAILAVTLVLRDGLAVFDADPDERAVLDLVDVGEEGRAADCFEQVTDGVAIAVVRLRRVERDGDGAVRVVEATAVESVCGDDFPPGRRIDEIYRCQRVDGAIGCSAAVRHAVSIPLPRELVEVDYAGIEDGAQRVGEQIALRGGSLDLRE